MINIEHANFIAPSVMRLYVNYIGIVRVPHELQN